MNGGTQLGTASITSGVATFTISTLAAGKYAVTAVYGGDSTFLTSTSTAVNLTVSATPAAIVTLTSSAPTANSGQSVTLTSTVAAFSESGVPTGTVTFQVAGSPLLNGTVLLSAGTATLTTTELPIGNDEIIAVYNGDSNFAANASANVIVTVTSSGQLQFTPGVISTVSGSYFTPSATAGNQIAADSYGNVYYVSYSGASLSVVASGNGPIPGIATPVKGTSYTIGNVAACTSSASCGDGGQVSQASFRSLGAITIDALNNIYLGDSGRSGTAENSVVRRISAATGHHQHRGGDVG